MQILDLIKAKLGVQKTEIDPNLVEELNRIKKERAIQRRQELEEQTARGERESQEKKRKYEEEQASIQALTTTANRLFRPKLEAIKKVDGHGKGNITANSFTDSKGQLGVTLTLQWNHATVHHPAYSMGRASSPPSDERVWTETYFTLLADGSATFGQRHRSEHRPSLDAYGQPPIQIDTTDPNWQIGLAERISQILNGKK